MGCHFSGVSGMNCLIFNYLQMSASPGLMYIFQEKLCMQSSDQILLKGETGT